MVIYTVVVIAIVVLSSLSLAYILKKNNLLNMRAVLSILFGSVTISLLFPFLIGAFFLYIGIKFWISVALSLLIYFVAVFLFSMLISFFIVGNVSSHVLATGKGAKNITGKISAVLGRLSGLLLQVIDKLPLPDAIKNKLPKITITEETVAQAAPSQEQTGEDVQGEGTDVEVEVAAINEAEAAEISEVEESTGIAEIEADAVAPAVENDVADIPDTAGTEVETGMPVEVENDEDFTEEQPQDDIGEGKNILEKFVDTEQNIDTMGIETFEDSGLLSDTEADREDETGEQAETAEDAITEPVVEDEIISSDSDVGEEMPNEFETSIDYFDEKTVVDSEIEIQENEQISDINIDELSLEEAEAPVEETIEGIVEEPEVIEDTLEAIEIPEAEVIEETIEELEISEVEAVEEAIEPAETTDIEAIEEEHVVEEQVEEQLPEPIEEFTAEELIAAVGEEEAEVPVEDIVEEAIEEIVEEPEAIEEILEAVEIPEAEVIEETIEDLETPEVEVVEEAIEPVEVTDIETIEEEQIVEEQVEEQLPKQEKVWSADDYVGVAFKLKESGDFGGAIQQYMNALEQKPDNHTVFWIILDTCVLYKELGQAELAREILGSYVEAYGDIMDESVRLEIERNLL